MSFSRPARRILVFLSLLLCLLTALGAEETIDYNQRVVEMLEGYQKLMSTQLDDDVDDKPGVSWSIVSQALEKGFLRFTIDPVNPSIIEGTRFFASPGSNTTHIVVNHRLLDIWGSHPSMAYAVLTRSVREASNFFRDPESWGLAQNDVIEKLFISIDGYGAEAEVIRDRLIPSGYLITPYESYVLDSFEKDGLISLAMFLERFSLPVAQGLYDARMAFETDENANAMRELVIELGESLLEARDSIPSGSPDNTVFPLAVAIHSWLEATPVLISRIHNKARQDNPLDFGQVLARESDYAETRRLLEASRTRDMPMMNHVYQENVSAFENPE